NRNRAHADCSSGNRSLVCFSRIPSFQSDGFDAVTVLSDMVSDWVIWRHRAAENNVHAILPERIGCDIAATGLQTAVTNDIKAEAPMVVVAGLQSIADVKLNVVEAIDGYFLDSGLLVL